jgi:uncharacterized protein (DUF488 family)
MTRQMPKFTRQKFLLTFIHSAGKSISKLDLQKLLFLYHRKQNAAHFEFIPYLYGCYSFQANADLDVLENQGWIIIDDSQISIADGKMPSLTESDQIQRFFSENTTLAGKDLIATVYRTYPYYAINSRIAGNLLSKNELDKISELREKYRMQETGLFTIGYEGVTFESYINTLIRNDIRVLCDVRNNPLSRKFGFSKSTLSAVLPKIGIQYVHIPELGIESAKRQDLETEIDYKVLFEKYRKTLPDKKVFINKVIALLETYKRVALTCFEKEPACCHRHTLSLYIKGVHSTEVTDL